jgi:hypothetical protein
LIIPSGSPTGKLRKAITVFALSGKNLSKFSSDILSALIEKNSDKTAEVIHYLLSVITHRQHKPDESYYHTIIQAAFIVAQLLPLGEVAGADGQADIVLFLPGDKKAIVEIKYSLAEEKNTEAKIEKVLTTGLNKALKAISEKNYAGPFMLWPGEVFGLGLSIYGRDMVKAGFKEIEKKLMRNNKQAILSEGQRNRLSLAAKHPPLKREAFLIFFVNLPSTLLWRAYRSKKADLTAK